MVAHLADRWVYVSAGLMVAWSALPKVVQKVAVRAESMADRLVVWKAARWAVYSVEK
jgi:hypothetical protein